MIIITTTATIINVVESPPFVPGVDVGLELGLAVAVGVEVGPCVGDAVAVGDVVGVAEGLGVEVGRP